MGEAYAFSALFVIGTVSAVAAAATGEQGLWFIAVGAAFCLGIMVGRAEMDRG